MEGSIALLGFGEGGWGPSIASGVLVTVSLALATLPVGLAIGFFVALGKQSPEPSVKLAANMYTTIFRGLPELLTLFLVYFGGQIGIQKLGQLLGYTGTIEINSFIAGMFAMGRSFPPMPAKYSSRLFAPFRKVSMRAVMLLASPTARQCARSSCRN